MKDQIENFIAEFAHSISEGRFVRLTLGNYKGQDEHLQRVGIRPVDTKKGRVFAFQSRYATRDVVKNFSADEAAARLTELIDSGFRSAHLFTTTGDVQLAVGKKNARLIKGKPSHKAKISTTHDREKKRFVDQSAYYLKALRITTHDGKVRSDQRDKWIQINKFVEIVSGLIEHSSLKGKDELRIVDMGSGKGYLTFALYEHLSGRSATGMDRASESARTFSVTGIEQRPELVSFCNDVAKTSGFDGLNFVDGNIDGAEIGDVDVLIALHACDTATDDALYKGITANASVIVAAPCCHKEVKAQLKAPKLLAGILKHSILLERTAETITDGIRSMLLESRGYKTKIFEFVSTEHTPKNNLLVATKASGTPSAPADLEEVTRAFGIEHQRLNDLLKI